MKQARHPLTIAVPLLILLVASAHAFESERIAVTTSGAGPAILFIPGMNSSPAVWDEVTERLDGSGIHLIQVKGFAGLPADGNAAGEILPELAREIARYIDEEGLDDVSVVGHSMGGLVGTMVAARHPDLVDQLMVVDIPAYFGDIMGIPPEQIEGVADAMRLEALARTEEARDLAEIAFIEAGVLDEGKRQLVIEDMRSSDPAVGAQALYEVMTTDLRPELAQVAAETTIVFAQPAQAPDMTQDAVTGFYASQYGTIPDARFEFIPDSGHYVMLDQPERLAELIEELVR
jgi:pimeloyl-ACP methyl ester carboxylesterase